MALSIRPPSVLTVEPSGFGFWTGYFFAVNCVVGAGFLSLPWAYEKGGWLFCLLYQIFMTIFSLILSHMVFEIMSRVEVLTRIQELGKDLPTLDFKLLIFGKSKGEQLIPITDQEPKITSRRTDLSEIARLLFGEHFGRIYLVILYIYQQGIQVSYASIFSSSFASNIPLGNLDTCDVYEEAGFYNHCKWKYWIYLLIFGGFMVYLTLKGMEEQVWFQSCMTFMRFLVMSLVIITSIYDIATSNSNESKNRNNIEMPPLIAFEHIGSAIPIVLVAMAFQNSIPTIVQHVTDKETNLKKIANASTLTAFGFYTLLGMLVPVAIDDVPSMSTLSYRNYTAGHESHNRPWWTYMIEYIVVIFPALDVFSSFPIQAITLADNLCTRYYGNIPKFHMPRRGVRLFRLLVVIPPLIIAFLEYNLGFILEWTGLLGILLIPVAIPMMHLAARRLVDGESVHDINIVSPMLCVVLSAAHVLISILVVVLIILESAK